MLLSVGLGALPLAGAARAQPLPSIVGRDGWLYYPNDQIWYSDLRTIEPSLDLVKSVNAALVRNGTRLVVVIVPIKARVYGTHLPPEAPLIPAVVKRYQWAAAILRADGVLVPDLDEQLLQAATSRDASAEPLYFRTDTHWSPAGALTAAEAIARFAQRSRALGKALEAVPQVAYSMARTQFNPFRGDLLAYLASGTGLPADAPGDTFAALVAERLTPATSLLDAPAPEVALVGTSYSASWIGFPDALRYALQKDVAALSISADKGQWYGLETYLRDDAFQASRPKVLFWEMPERELTAFPDAAWRQPRYKRDNADWLLSTTSLIEKDCRPSPVTAQLEVGSLNSVVGASEFSAPSSRAGDFVRYGLSGPLSRLDYLEVEFEARGSDELIFEGLTGEAGSGPLFRVPVADDGTVRRVKVPLTVKGESGFTQVRLFPGETSGFTVKGFNVCRLPEDPLAR